MVVEVVVVDLFRHVSANTLSCPSPDSLLFTFYFSPSIRYLSISLIYRLNEILMRIIY